MSSDERCPAATRAENVISFKIIRPNLADNLPQKQHGLRFTVVLKRSTILYSTGDRQTEER